MFCPQCGSQQPGGAQFCQKCGFELKRATSALTDQVQQKIDNDSSTSTSPTALPLTFRIALLIGAVSSTVLFIDFLGVFIEKYERVAYLISLYGRSAAMMGSIVLLVLVMVFLSALAGLALMGFLACVLSGQPAQRALKQSCRSAIQLVVVCAITLLVGMLLDEPSLSSSDIRGPLYVIGALLSAWISRQILPLAVSVCIPLVIRNVFGKNIGLLDGPL